MKTSVAKTRKNKSQFTTDSSPKHQDNSESAAQFADNRPEAVVQRKLQKLANNSPQVKQLTVYQAMADNYISATAQRKENPEEEAISSKPEPVQQRENKTGLPNSLKSGVENLSGFSMDDVKVHFHSEKPAQLQSFAFAHGTDIHVASGQEKHLPHEAWHVVQQKQGRVKPTAKTEAKVAVNDDTRLETEADAMGMSAMASGSKPEFVQRKLQQEKSYGGGVKQLKDFNSLESKGLVQQVTKSDVTQLVSIWDEVNVGFGAKTKRKPQELADSLTEGSEEFSKLRGTANVQTQEHFGANLSYKPRPAKGGGTSEAYFKDDATYYNMAGHPAMILANLIFETANAAQSGGFIKVENDYISGAIKKKSIHDYGFDDLGDNLTEEYENGDAEARRSIIQERFEWNSFMLARPSFLEVKAEMAKNPQSKDMYNVYFAAFDDMLTMNSFEEYYNTYGKIHRNAVEGVLRKVAEQEIKKNKSKCYLTTACAEAKGLPNDCEELTVLREFRDSYLTNKENGHSLIATYYKHAPQIVSAVKRRDDAKDILAGMYTIIRESVNAIKRGDNDFAFQTYCKMVAEFKNMYIPEVEVSPSVHLA